MMKMFCKREKSVNGINFSKNISEDQLALPYRLFSNLQPCPLEWLVNFKEVDYMCDCDTEFVLET